SSAASPATSCSRNDRSGTPALLRSDPTGKTVRVSDETTTATLIEQAVGEIDVSLLDWYLSLSVIERLRAASRSAAMLERLRRGATSDR
ncbi:MAG: hypothetical protein WKG01_42335, partial [Kofleriaceae bacterium]